MTVRELRAASGMTMKQFADYFGIPLRSVENWCTVSAISKRECPSYLINLMHFKLVTDGIIKPD